MIRAIRKYLLGVSSENVNLDVRNFNYRDEQIRKHLETIGLTFLKGYHAYLENLSIENFPEQIKDVPKVYKGFAYEGLAMSMAIMDFMMPWRSSQLCPFMEEEGNDHIYMLHVGAGWGMARVFGKPEQLIQKYHPLYRWLAIDGYGFHQAYFYTEKYVNKRQKPKKISQEALPVFYQGLGRCLWFIEGAQPKRILERIQTFPAEWHADLWSGIGLAATYACGVDKETIRLLRKLSGRYLINLGSGAAFAAKARSRAKNVTDETVFACKIITGKRVEELGEITEEAKPKLKNLTGNVTSYLNWKSAIGTLIYEPQITSISLAK